MSLLVIHKLQGVVQMGLFLPPPVAARSDYEEVPQKRTQHNEEWQILCRVLLTLLRLLIKTDHG